MVRVLLVGLIAGGRSGVPRYAATLARALDRVAPEHPGLEMRMLTTARGARLTAMRNVPVQLAGWPFAEANAGLTRIAGEQLGCRSAPADLLHFFDLAGPILAPRRRFVTTIHDAAIRHRFERARVAHKHLIQPWAVKRATRSIAVSRFARDEAVRHFGADPARIAVIHSGPGLSPDAGRSAPAREADPRDAGPYLLCVGNVSAHKNLPFLVGAFDAAGLEDIRLLLVGARGERFDEVEAAVAATPGRDRIEIRRDVGDAELDGLYRGAVALVLPSLYEGFGFTALEAMSRDCPVLASDIPALREVSGRGAMLLPAGDREAWATAIRRIAADGELGDELRSRGREQARLYSWEETARRVCALFLEAGS